VVAFGLLLAATGLTARAQNLIQNGSFETPVVSLGTATILGIPVVVPGAEAFVDTGSPNTGITDWSVTQGAVTLINNGGGVVNALGLLTAPDGSQFAVLNSLTISPLGIISAGATGTLSQTFATNAGDAYQLSFDYAGLSVSALNGTAELQVTVSNSRSSTAPNNGATIHVSVNSFQNETFDFVATGSSSTLTFDEPTGSLANANGVALDDVTLSDLGSVPVPEFPHYGLAVVLFLGGLAITRLAGEARRRSATA
jgi:hypothetical protein